MQKSFLAIPPPVPRFLITLHRRLTARSPFVGASSISFASAYWRKLTHYAAPPLPTKAEGRFGGAPIMSRAGLRAATQPFTRPRSGPGSLAAVCSALPDHASQAADRSVAFPTTRAGLRAATRPSARPRSGPGSLAAVCSALPRKISQRNCQRPLMFFAAHSKIEELQQSLTRFL